MNHSLLPFNSKLLTLLLLLLGSLGPWQSAHAQTIIIYQNDFTAPLLPPVTTCSPDLDQSTVQSLWGGTGEGIGGGGHFSQENTVETLILNGPDRQYADSSGLGGQYAIGMLSDRHEDRLALTLNAHLLSSIDLSFLLSPIDVPTCGGPFGLDTARVIVRVYDTPSGTFSFRYPGTKLDQKMLTGGDQGATPHTLAWKQVSTSLDISAATDSTITLVFDAIQSGYLSFDNIIISSTTTAVVDHRLKQLSLYPNPVGEELVLDNTSPDGTLSIFNAMGASIWIGTAMSWQTRVSTGNLPSGTYFLTYTHSGVREVHRFTK